MSKKRQAPFYEGDTFPIEGKNGTISMKVIAGRFKGQILKMPGGLKVRPSSQKVKEALFSILGRSICGASFLELFAGSGSIGIEALSRGARQVFLVENNRTCIKIIEKNLAQLKVLYNYGFKSGEVKLKIALTVLALDAEGAISLLAQKKQRFDFVFLDPPYYQNSLKNSLIKICHYDILNARSYVIAEHNKRQILPQQLPVLTLMFTKTYGDTALSLYQKKP